MDPRANHSLSSRFGTPQYWCQLNNSNIRRASRRFEPAQPPADNFMKHLSEWLDISKDNASRMIFGSPTVGNLTPQLVANGISELITSRKKGITYTKITSVHISNPTPILTAVQRNSTGLEELTLEALDERWQIYLIILYTLTAVASFVLNALTVLVLIRRHKCLLKRYIINLSMSDLLMSLLSIRKYISSDYGTRVCPRPSEAELSTLSSSSSSHYIVSVQFLLFLT